MQGDSATQVLNILTNPAVISGFQFLWKVFVFMIPVFLMFIAWKKWVYYVRRLFITNMKWVTLQVKVPRDVFKTPQAMELFLTNSLHQTGGTKTWINRFWEGKVRMWFSLELVSIEGKVFFFIHTPSFFKNLIESQIYAQYPRAEIAEVPDYTAEAAALMEREEWSMFGTEFKLTKPDPYPIKTYVDYGLDKATNLEEEYKIDPITPMLEYLGSLGPNEQAWIQIMVRAADERHHKPGTWFEKQKWTDVAKDEIKKIMEKYATKDKDGKKVLDPTKLPKAEQDVIAAISRGVDKLGFDVGMRGIYLAKKENFNPINIVGLLSNVKQYSSQNLNGFAPTNVTSFDNPWQDWKGMRLNKLRKEIFDAYRLRSFFYPPHNKKKTALKTIERTPFVLNSEELATIYHFPGKVSETPTFKRIESKKAEPPANLPL